MPVLSYLQLGLFNFVDCPTGYQWCWVYVCILKVGLVWFGLFPWVCLLLIHMSLFGPTLPSR